MTGTDGSSEWLRDPFPTPQVFNTYFYSNAHRLHLKKLLIFYLQDFFFLEVSAGFFYDFCFWIQVVGSFL
jgi:hypothetical protein